MEVSSADGTEDGLFTPVQYASPGRKRKIMDAARRLNNLKLNDSVTYASHDYYRTTPDVTNVFSSTLLNESDNNDSGLRFDYSSIDEKRPKLVDAGSGYKFTPSKKYQASSTHTPERFKILYADLPVVQPPSKNKTPQKYLSGTRGKSPAKKNLFPVRLDPFRYFAVDRNCKHVVRKIFNCLSAKELYGLTRVCKLSQRLLTEDEAAHERFFAYLAEKRGDKENGCDVGKSPADVDSPPPSPDSKNFYTCRKTVELLNSSQNLSKCPMCHKLAIVEEAIAQCNNPHCTYIWCEMCGAFSVEGAKGFIDRCRTNASSSKPFANLSNIDTSQCSPNFLQPLHCSSANQTPTLESSGYSSMNETLSSSSGNGNGSAVLANHNRISDRKSLSNGIRKIKVQLNNITAVGLLLTTSSQRVEPPRSPPATNRQHVACSEASRKRLRRL